MYITDGHDDTGQGRPDEPQEANNVIFHSDITICQQLLYTK